MIKGYLSYFGISLEEEEEDEDDYDGLEDNTYMILAGSRRSSGQSSGRRSHGRSDSGGSGYGSGSGSGSGRQTFTARREIRGSDVRDYGGRGGYENGGHVYGNAYGNGNGYGNGYGQAFRPGGIDMVVRSPVYAGHALDSRAAF